MSRDKQMINDLIEIFDEEYGKRNLITPQNTAEKLTDKGYRKASEVAKEIAEEILEMAECYGGGVLFWRKMRQFAAELKQKCTEGEE
jgi:hypothetical protein